jgi:thymidylate kinase
MRRSRPFPRFIYVAGCDGTGKSTQVGLLLGLLQAEGIQARHLWLRFPFFFSIPFLFYARARGYSWSEVVEGERYGYWDFRESRLLRHLFPWALLIDAALASVTKIHIPILLGCTVVCERFVLDMLIDLAVAHRDSALYRKAPGKWFPGLLPSSSAVLILDLDADRVRARRPSLQYDRRLEARLALYRELAKSLGYPLISSAAHKDRVLRDILRVVRRPDGSVQ